MQKSIIHAKHIFVDKTQSLVLYTVYANVLRSQGKSI